MEALDESYRQCRAIASKSGSSFYRSFSILTGQRRNAMDALYAFARIIDDVSDSQPNSNIAMSNWDSDRWHEWVCNLFSTAGTSVALSELQGIRPALVDATSRFAIPLQVFHDLIDGIDLDQRGNVALQTWNDLRTYCEQVASSVGIGCLSIWATNPGAPIPDDVIRDARSCGIAFQLTNVLRDIVEDSRRGRCYLPKEDLERFGVSSAEWSIWLSNPSAAMSRNQFSQVAAVLQLYVERAEGYFEAGKEVRRSLCREGQRMFSLMWETYFAILREIKKSPTRVLEGRVSIAWHKKTTLALSHLCTPIYTKLFPVYRGHATPKQVVTNGAEPQSYKVAVIGGGLSGCNAAIHLARHGVSVELFEAKSRLGGRVGSFVDRQSGQSVDYCQHVGMKCCHELVRWIRETEQEDAWSKQTSLHFASKNGTKISISSLPLPAPFHLANLLWRWPDLSLTDRLSIGKALLQLVRMKQSHALDQCLAMDWLTSLGQSPRSLKNFWETILVSALGEQISRVTLGATRKVLVDGFAATRDAFHLLVPNRPLAELTDSQVRNRLQQLGVCIHDQRIVSRIESTNHSMVRVVDRNGDMQLFDRVVIAVPWNQLAGLIPMEAAVSQSLSQIQSSPITGIHTWWDRDWLTTPHAILIDRLCQWIFPAPESQARSSFDTSGPGNKSTYYQIVISASHDLSNGEPDQIAKRIKADLAEAFPESAVATMFRFKIVTDPNAVFSISPDIADARFATTQWGEEGIYLAGDWTNTGWPATMEGALRSGIMAAEQVLKSLARPAKILHSR